jgi:O-antigen/teichoic acid export membrane protein
VRQPRALAGATRWYLVGNVSPKVLSFFVQIALGYLLLPEAFGVYAIVMSVAMIAGSASNGGVVEHMVAARVDTRGPVVNAALWVAALSNVAIGATIALLAFPLSRIFNEPQLLPMLLLLALTYPLGTYASVLGGLMRAQGRAGLFNVLGILNSALRYALMLGLAFELRNAYALIIPSVFTSITGSCAMLIATRHPIWPGRPRRTDIARLARRSSWLVAGTAAAALMQSGDYLGLGLTASSTLLGYYFFAYQIPAQVGALAVTSSDTLLPHLARSTGVVRRVVFRKYVETLTLATSGVLALLAGTFPAVETLLWGGKWDASIVACQIISAALPIRLLYSVTKVAQLSGGRYRAWAWQTAVVGAGMVAVSAAVGYLLEDLALVTAVIATYLVIATLVNLCTNLKRDGLPITETLAAIARNLLPAALAVLVFVVAPTPADSTSSLLWFLAGTTLAYSGAFIVASRWIAPGTFQEISSILVSRTQRR